MMCVSDAVFYNGDRDLIKVHFKNIVRPFVLFTLSYPLLKNLKQEGLSQQQTLDWDNNRSLNKILNTTHMCIWSKLKS
jgi:hypothetical protein